MELSIFVLEALKAELLGKKIKLCTYEKKYENLVDIRNYTQEQKEELYLKYKKHFKFGESFRNVLSLPTVIHRKYEVGIIEDVIMNVKANFVYSFIKLENGELKYFPLPFEYHLNEIAPDLYMFENPTENVLLNHIK